MIILFDSTYFLTRSQDLSQYLISIYRDIHKFPELSLEEKRTSSKVAEELKKFGLKVRERVGGYGVIGHLKGGKENPL